MANRKKRLKKGMESISKQIELHQEKREKAKKEDIIGLVKYYDKELDSFKKSLKKKKRMLEKGS
ncbi:MAG TPA: hypothetical protein VJB90_04280 [Candidatus Nanoarchaeia archaeon]|nr:hypothetical protein [Candidatus Nanoarchaeia archaeon]